MEDLNNILNNFNSQFKKVDNLSRLNELRVAFLGKKGEVTALFSQMKNIDPQQRKEFGAKVNKLRDEIAIQIDEKNQYFENVELEKKLAQEKIDVSEPVRKTAEGFAHPIAKVIKEIREIFNGLGYDFADGPEIEEDFFNFTALNMPKNHPARQMQDTFYLKGEGDKLLRTHTSNTQIRKMLDEEPPFKSVALGRVFRRDSDQTHTPMFHQIEGFVVDEKVTMSNLKWVLEEFLRQFFDSSDIHLRFRPSFFPFTEPSAEVDIGYEKEKGKIKIGSDKNFMEILGCGMIHPNVLKNCNIDNKKYQGFAFGIGIERLAMLKYGIEDLRMFFDNDIRFLKHFGFSLKDF